MTWFLKFLRHSDFVGKEPSLMLGKDSRNRTILGGLLCISIILCTLLGLIYFGQEIYYKRNPNIVTSNIPFAQGDSIRVDSKNSTFYFSIRDSSGNPLKNEESYLNVNITLNSRNIKGGVNSFNPISSLLSYKNCEKNNFLYTDSNSLINPKTRENWKCLSLIDSDNPSVFLAGNQQSNEYSFINIIVKPCSIDDSTCKSPEEIKKAISGAYLVFGYNEYLFDLRKSKNFAHSYLKEEEIFFSSLDKSSQFIQYELKKYHFYTDTGILIQDFQEDTFLKYKLINKEMILKDNNNNINDNSYIEINLIPSVEKKNIYRKYYKIQNLIAEIGGLSKSFVLIALVLNYINDQSRYYTIMIDNLFDGDDVFKYFQYYHHNNKKLHKKYRDSVILTSSKKIESFVRERQSPLASFKSKSPNAYNSNRNANSPNLLNNFLNDSSNNILKEKTQQQDFLGNSSNLSKPDDCCNYENNLIVENFEKLSNNQPNNPNNEINQDVNKISQSNSNNSHTVYFNVSSDNLSIKMLSEKLKKSKIHKENFYKLQKKKFKFNSIDMIKYIFCPTTFEYSNKRSIFYGGKEMIQKRTDIISILKKNLEFDRFKNLLLDDNQILLLNSLNKFMLDPERLELVDYEKSNYEKIIDAYITSRANDDKIDSTLTAWMKSKFHFTEK